jgi:hypothetical protein
MELINYDEAGNEGGIEALEAICADIPVILEVGKIAIRPEHTVDLPPGLTPEEEEDLLAA